VTDAACNPRELEIAAANKASKHPFRAILNHEVIPLSSPFWVLLVLCLVKE